MIYRTAYSLGAAALITAFAPDAAFVAIPIVALFLAAAAADAFRSSGMLDEVRIKAPDISRQTAGRAGFYELFLTAPLPCRVAVGADAEAALDETPVLGSGGKILLPCKPLRRGCFKADCASCETDSRWGFWTVLRRFPLDSEIRVYPDLGAEKQEAPEVFLRGNAAGARTRRFTGKGREFEKLREYVPGDDIGDIHWKATARRRFPVTKIFRLERSRDVIVALDASRLSHSLLDPFIRAALALALAAEKEGDRFGLLLFDRNIETFVPPGSGKRSFDACRNTLYKAETKPVSPDFREVFSFIAARVPKRSLIMFLTQLGDRATADRFTECASAGGSSANRHLFAVPLFAREKSAGSEGDAQPYRELASAMEKRDLETLRNRLRSVGMRSVIAPADKPLTALLGLYRHAKERQLL